MYVRQFNQIRWKSIQIERNQVKQNAEYNFTAWIYFI